MSKKRIKLSKEKQTPRQVIFEVPPFDNFAGTSVKPAHRADEELQKQIDAELEIEVNELKAIAEHAKQHGLTFAKAKVSYLANEQNRKEFDKVRKQKQDGDFYATRK